VKYTQLEPTSVTSATNQHAHVQEITMTRDKKLTYKLTLIDYIARLSDTWN